MNAMLHTLIVTAAIAAILTFSVIGPLTSYLEHAQRAVQKVQKHQIATALEMYYATNGRYLPADSIDQALTHLRTHGYLAENPDQLKELHYHTTNNGQDYSFSKEPPKSAVERLYHQ